MAPILEVLRLYFTEDGAQPMDERSFQALRLFVREKNADVRVVDLEAEPEVDADRLAGVAAAKRRYVAQAAQVMDCIKVPWTVAPKRTQQHIMGAFDLVSEDTTLLVKVGYLPPDQVLMVLRAGYGLLLLSPYFEDYALMLLPNRERIPSPIAHSAPGWNISDFLKMIAVSGVVELALSYLTGVMGLGLVALALLVIWRFLWQAKASRLLDVVERLLVLVAIMLVAVDLEAYLRNSLLLAVVALFYFGNLLSAYLSVSPALRQQGLQALLARLPSDVRREVQRALIFAGVLLTLALVSLGLGMM